jgi:hypothetical protein
MLTKVTFRLAGYDAALTAAAVTRRLGLQPASAFEADTPTTRRTDPRAFEADTPTTRRTAPRAFEADTPAARRTAPRARGYSLWLISSSPQIEPDVELGEHLRRLLAILEPVTTSLWELAHAGYEANWYCFAASHAAEHAIELDRPILQRLLALPGDLWLDVCGDGADDA